MWCFARLFHYPGAELLQAISLYCLRHWHRFKAQELANMIWSLALLRACSHDTWCAYQKQSTFLSRLLCRPFLRSHWFPESWLFRQHSRLVSCSLHHCSGIGYSNRAIGPRVLFIWLKHALGRLRVWNPRYLHPAPWK